MVEDPIPHLVSRPAELGPVSADPEAFHWQKAAAVPLVETATGGSPNQATEFKIVHDSRNLRILFIAQDSDPWATYTERDSPLYEEEVVEVFLDPQGDLEAYFEFEVNPNNARMDVALRRIKSGYRKDFRWCCEGFDSAVRMEEGRWITEFSIPFASLGNAAPAGVWRANLYRIDRPKGQPWELSAWAPTRAANFHTPRRFGSLQFVEIE